MTAYRFRRQRTTLTCLVVHLPWPPSLLAAEGDGLGEKRRCLEAILRLEPGNAQVHAAWLWVLQEQQRQRTASDDHLYRLCCKGEGGVKNALLNLERYARSAKNLTAPGRKYQFGFEALSSTGKTVSNERKKHGVYRNLPQIPQI